MATISGSHSQTEYASARNTLQWSPFLLDLSKYPKLRELAVGTQETRLETKFGIPKSGCQVAGELAFCAVKLATNCEAPGYGLLKPRNTQNRYRLKKT